VLELPRHITRAFARFRIALLHMQPPWRRDKLTKRSQSRVVVERSDQAQLFAEATQHDGALSEETDDFIRAAGPRSSFKHFCLRRCFIDAWSTSARFHFARLNVM
jgi:hypothetical protein